MKKLIALIGAVATAFGLYATDLVESAISFEADDAGSSGATLDITAGDARRQGDAVLWATDAEDFDAPKIKAYADETAPIAAYDGYDSGKLRRDSAAAGKNWFINGTTSDKYLSLSTGTNSLIRTFADKADPLSTVTVSEGLFVDTLVRFTGYEEDPVITEDGDEKVAIWLKAIEDDPDTEEDEGTTNLYITCGRSYDSGDKLVTLEITNKGYAPEKWYRLTIKSIGDIFNKGDEHRLGFLVWIDGEQIACEGATDLVQLTGSMTQKAAEYQRLGQLFPSIKTGLELVGAGFQGMGQIDDLIVSKADADGTPDFANEINFKVTATGAKVLAVTNSVTGAEVKFLDGFYTVKPGEKVDVYFGANGPYVLTPPIKKVPEVAVNSTEIDLSDEVDADPAVAQIDGDTPVYFATMAEAFAAAQVGDTIRTLEDAQSYAPTGDAEKNFEFPLDTTITIEENNGWTIVLPEPEVAEEEETVEEEEAEVTPVYLVNNFGAAAGQVIVLTGNMILSAGIPADAAILVSGETILQADIAVNGEIQTDTLVNANEEEDRTSDFYLMTLGVNGAYQQTAQITTLANFFTNDADKISETPVKESEEEEEPSAYRYTLKGGVEFTLVAPENTSVETVSGADPVSGKEGYYTAEDGAPVTVTLQTTGDYVFDEDGTTEKDVNVTAKDGPITIELETPAFKPAAKKGLKFFITLQDAIDAEDSTELEADNTVYVLDNIALEARVNINKDAVIDLGTFTLTSTAAGYTDTSFLVKIANDADVTIKNGAVAATAAAKPNCGIWVDGGELDLVDVDVTAPLKAVQVTKTSALTVDADSVVTGTGDDSAIFINTQNGDTTIEDPSTITIAGTVKNTYAAAATADSTNYAISGNGNDKAGANVVISDGAVVQSDTLTAIFFPCAGTLTVNGGTITGCEFGIYAKSGTVTINDGEITATTETVVPVAVDNDGYTGAGYAVCLETGSEQGGYANNLSFAVYGGKFTSEGAAVYNFVREGADPIAPGITAGAFKAMPDVALIVTTAGQTAKWVLNEETGYYEPSIATMVCQIGTTQYATIQEAINAVESNATIQIIANIDYVQNAGDAEEINVINGKKIINLDLNGKTITAKWASDFVRSGNTFTVFYIEGGSSLTIDDTTVGKAGTIRITEYPDWGWNAGVSTVFNHGGILTINAGTYDNAGLASMSYSFDAYAGQTTINGGTYHAPNYTTFRQSANGNMTINNGTFTGKRAVYPAGGGNGATITINGGTFKAWEQMFHIEGSANDRIDFTIDINAGSFALDAEDASIRPDGKPAVALGGIFNNSSDYFVGKTVINVKGGTFTQSTGSLVADTHDQLVVALRAGTYDTNVAGNYLANENYALRDNENETWTVYTLYMCQIAGDTPVKYGDLATAIAEAVEGDVIELIEDSEFEFLNDYATVDNKAITLDLNGKKLKGTANKADNTNERNMIKVTSTGDLTVLDSTVAEGGYGTGELCFEYINFGPMLTGAGYYLIHNFGTFTLKSGKLVAYDSGVGELVYGIENIVHSSYRNSPTLNIEGGYICVPDWCGQACVRTYCYDNKANPNPEWVNTVNISGGVIVNVYPFSMSYGQGMGGIVKVNITGGEFQGYCGFNASSDGTEVKISGGEFYDAEAYPSYSLNIADSRPNKDKPFLFIEGGEFNVYQFAGASAVDTLVRGGTFNKVGHAAENPQDIEQLLGVDCLAVYAQKKDAETDGFFTVELIPVALDIDGGEGVASFTYTVNDEEPDENQKVKFGDVIKITNVVYADGYAEGEIKKDTEITVGEDLLVDETGALVEAVVVTVDAVRGAAKKGLKVFITLQEALDDTEETGDIVLLKDVTADGVEVAAAAAIDMAGYTLTVSEGETLTLGDAVTLKNSVAGQGGFLNAGTIAISADQDFSNLAWGAGGFINAGPNTSAKLAIAADATVKMPTATVDLDPNQMATVTPGFWTGTATGAKVFAAANMWKYNGATWDAAVATVNDAYYFTVADALAAVQVAEAAGTFPIEVVALADGLVIPGPDNQSITLAKNGAITIKADSWAFAPAPVITKVVLVEGKKLVFPTQIANFKDVILCADGYKVVETAVDGGFEYTVALDQAFGGGSGTEADPYIIANYGHLEDLQKWTADGKATTDVYFKQTKDIDMAGKVWGGIGASASGKRFCSTYDGGNFTISNLTIKRERSYQRGLFGVTDCATIKNLTVVTIGFDTEDTSVAEPGGGTLIGYVLGGTMISNVTTKGTLAGGYTTGGMVGALGEVAPIAVSGMNLTFVDCTNEVNVTSTKDKFGGLLAYSGYTAKTAVEFIRCVNKGTITVPANVEANGGAGEFIGWADNSTAGGHIFTDCVAAGSIVKPESVETTAIGSFIGKKSGEKVTTATGTNVASASLRAVGTDDAAKVSGLNFATVAGDVATFVAEDDIADEGEYKVMVKGAAYELPAGESITLDETIATATITTVEGYFVDDTTVPGTYTSVALPTLTVTDNTEATATATVTTNGEIVTDFPVTLNVGDTYVVTSVAAENYTYEGVKLDDGWTLSEDKTTITFEGEAKAADVISITVPAAVEAATDITVTVKKGSGIDSVTVGGKALVFDETTSEATFTVKPDVLTATLTLAAESTIKIPAYTMSIGEGSEGWTVTNKTPVVTADAENLAKNYFTFAAEEASTTDPAITDDAAATAIKEAAPAVAEKVDALTTGDGAIGGKALVNWIATKGGNDAATALAGNYVKASVALDVAPITESTVVKVDTVEKATSDLAVTIKVGDVDATVDQIKSFVEVCDDLGVADGWEKLPQSTLQSAVKIEEGKLVITPVAGIDKLFLKVVIPADAK